MGQLGQNSGGGMGGGAGGQQGSPKALGGGMRSPGLRPPQQGFQAAMPQPGMAPGGPPQGGNPMMASLGPALMALMAQRGQQPTGPQVMRPNGPPPGAPMPGGPAMPPPAPMPMPGGPMMGGGGAEGWQPPLAQPSMMPMGGGGGNRNLMMDLFNNRVM